MPRNGNFAQVRERPINQFTDPQDTLTAKISQSLNISLDHFLTAAAAAAANANLIRFRHNEIII